MRKSSHDLILKRLEENGFEALYVGGCVRDEELGEPVLDYDITTNATPDEIAILFQSNTVDHVGKKYGVTLVDGIEVATFRAEKEYESPGKPKVSFAKTFYEDTFRRDFTINAMGRRRNGSIIDYHNGQEDLKNKIIRAVGNPLDRFIEDPSRILRALYLASKLSFQIEEKTFQTIYNYSYLLDEVPIELIGKILMKVLKANCLHSFMILLQKSNTLKYVFPDLVHTIGLPQNPKYHNSNVFEHILRVVRSVEINYPRNVILLLVADLHDVGKGLEGIRGINKEGQPNDIGHEKAGVPIAEKALLSLQFGKDIVRKVCFLIEFHGVRLEENPKKSTVIKTIRKMSPYFKDKHELQEGITLLFQFMDCDAEGFDPEFGAEMKRINQKVYTSFEEVLRTTIFYRAELPINGNNLLQYGITGKKIAEVMELLILENLQEKESVDSFLRKKQIISAN